MQSLTSIALITGALNTSFSPMAGNVGDLAPRANEDRDRRRSWADQDGVKWGRWWAD